MKKVLLSHDGKMKMYLVPDEVADNLKEYCMHFGFDWLMNDPGGLRSYTTHFSSYPYIPRMN